MEKLKQFVTRKNLLLVSMIGGILGLVLVLSYMITINSTSFTSALSLLSFLCFLFYADFVLLLLLTLGYAFVIFFAQQKNVTMYVLGGCTLGAFISALICFPAVNAISQVLNGDFSAIFSLAYSGANVDIWMILMLILQVASGVIGGYLRFVKKGEELSQEDLSQIQDAAKQVGDTARKAAADVASGTVKLSEKWKAYYQTEKGKKNVRIVGAVVAVAVVAIAGVSIWSSMQKTPIDLTSACEVTYSGYDGEGYAYVYCDVDYDINDSQVATFVYDVTYTVENDGALSNGDKVKLTANYSEKTADSLKLKVENAERELTVEGLTPVYRTFADIPSDISSQFDQSTKDALNADIMADEGTSFGPESITINSCDNIGVYYAYNTYYGSGTVYYLYRVDVTREYSYAIDKNVEYYSVSVDPISSEYVLTLDDPESNDIYVSEVYLYDDEKTDQKAVDNFSLYMSDLEIVKENLSTDTYKDSRTDK